MAAIPRPGKVRKSIGLPDKAPIPFHVLARKLREAGAPWYSTQYTRRFLLRKAKQQLDTKGSQDVWVKNGVHYCVTSLARARQYFPGLLEAVATVEELSAVIDELREEKEAAQTRERNLLLQNKAMRKRLSDLEKQMEDVTLVVEGYARVTPAGPEVLLDPFAEGAG